jgi:uncharacterized protein YqfB (UPF0267 family)
MKYIITHYTITQGDQTLYAQSATVTTSDLNEAREEAENVFLDELRKHIKVNLTYKEVPDDTEPK